MIDAKDSRQIRRQIDEKIIRPMLQGTNDLDKQTEKETDIIYKCGGQTDLIGFFLSILCN